MKIIFEYLGLSISCQIVGENLECTLLLPEKYRSQVEGLTGNFNGDYSDDLVNRQNNLAVIISSANSATPAGDDTTTLNACLSCQSHPMKLKRLIYEFLAFRESSK